MSTEQPSVTGAPITDAQDHARVVRQLEHRIDLEALIASISTRFVSGDAGRIAAEVEAALAEGGRFIDRGPSQVYAIARRSRPAMKAQESDRETWLSPSEPL